MRVPLAKLLTPLVWRDGEGCRVTVDQPAAVGLDPWEDGVVPAKGEEGLRGHGSVVGIAVGQFSAGETQQVQHLVDGDGHQSPPFRRYVAWSWTAVLGVEDLEREEGGDHEVGDIDEFADLEVDGHGADDVGLLAGVAAFHEEIDHVD